MLATQLVITSDLLHQKTLCAGAHVHAGGLLVRAEQRRRAGDLDHLDLAAPGIGCVCQALVRGRGALILRAGRAHNLSLAPITQMADRAR